MAKLKTYTLYVTYGKPSGVMGNKTERVMVKKTMDGRDQFDAKVKLYNKMIHIGGEQQRTFIEIYYTKEAAEISMVIDDSFPAPITSQTGSLTPPTGRIFDTMRYFKIEYQVIKK